MGQALSSLFINNRYLKANHLILLVYNCKLCIKGKEAFIIQAISDSEWEVMRVVWAHKKTTTRQIIDGIQASQNWSESTIKTLVQRLVDKKYLKKHQTQKPFYYTPLVKQSTAVNQRIDGQIQAICRKDQAKVLSHLIDIGALSQTDCANLIAQLQVKEKNAPEVVECTCPPAKCHCHLPYEEKGLTT